jgi:antitoxin ChpS
MSADSGKLLADDLYPPPDDATVNGAIEDYARAVLAAYGSRLKGIYLFGSRARGEHTPDSDADIAVVLDDAGWDFWVEQDRLSDLAYDILMQNGADLQGWPIRVSNWEDPQTHYNPELIRAMRADGVAIGFGS